MGSIPCASLGLSGSFHVMGGYACGSDGKSCDVQVRANFRPNNLVTRGQSAKIVANTFYPNCQAN